MTAERLDVKPSGRLTVNAGVGINRVRVEDKPGVAYRLEMAVFVEGRSLGIRIAQVECANDAAMEAYMSAAEQLLGMDAFVHAHVLPAIQEILSSPEAMA
jgi:hypothetical protein